MGTVRSIFKQLQEQGYTFLSAFMPGSSSLEAFSEFGELDEVEGLSRVQHLSPLVKKESAPNTYSGNFGIDEFPLHSDLAHWAIPPRYLALRCIVGSSLVETHALDGNCLKNRFGTDLLRSTIVQSRRPIQNRKRLLPLLQRTEISDQLCLRWDSIYLRPATKQAEQVVQEMAEFIANAKTQNFKLINPGDTLILDNWRFLHGRTRIPEAAMNRKIDRTYLRSIS